MLYGCFIILCYFLLYCRGNQLCVHIYPPFGEFPSHLGLNRALSRVPCAIEEGSLVAYFMLHSVNMSVPISQFISSHPNFLPLVSIHLFSTSVSLSTLQIPGIYPEKTIIPKDTHTPSSLLHHCLQ